MTGARRAALVTGASRGIGRAIARRLAREGYDLTLTARDGDALRAAAEEFARLGARTEVAVGDMSDEDAVRSVADVHRAAYGRLDALVVSAGVGSSAPLGGYPMHRFDKQFTVNVRAPFVLIDACLDLLRETVTLSPETGTKIVAISSITAFAPEPGLAAYGASKAALVALCEAVNTEVSVAGVAATAICPGYVDTDMSAWMHERLAPTEMVTSEDIAELVLALTRTSRRAVVPHLPVVRAGSELWRA
ncbi:SDR family NAD(P)-dependent oxidoreductase [Streptomyces fuscichromogenes]|uniref:3-ketoacyl-ACP reductase n=1 Tax=Streptomyces fuscichromogenes TaxID=1324013 RepID=A0A917XFQ7_9ACTN|nr:SDR family oxidoreductase [Streptomyces fuscichromogenes]GGN19306.1 3-ketoacyl-ACP reductase [Streptomyces fuscichromogenes]